MSRIMMVAVFVCAAASGVPAGAQDATTDATTDAAVAATFEDPDLAWGPCPSFLPEGCALAVLHGDPAQPDADVFFKVPGGASIVRHWHTSSERMVLVSGELHVTYDGQATTRLLPGTYAYGPARLPHEAKCVSQAPCVLAIAFKEPVDAFEGGHRQDEPRARP